MTKKKFADINVDIDDKTITKAIKLFVSRLRPESQAVFRKQMRAKNDISHSTVDYKLRPALYSACLNEIFVEILEQEVKKK